MRLEIVVRRQEIEAESGEQKRKLITSSHTTTEWLKRHRNWAQSAYETEKNAPLAT